MPRTESEMFHGTQEYALDDRGRIPIPVEFRASFGDTPVWLVNGPEECLEIYPHEQFEVIRKEIEKIPPLSQAGRRVRRAFYSSAHKLSLDKQGRVLIPQEVREQRALRGTVVFSGRGDVLELWSKDSWEREQAEFMSSYSETLDRVLENRQ
jgi:MraZ protein